MYLGLWVIHYMYTVCFSEHILNLEIDNYLVFITHWNNISFHEQCSLKLQKSLHLCHGLMGQANLVIKQYKLYDKVCWGPNTGGDNHYFWF